jgi:hypothetical protein
MDEANRRVSSSIIQKALLELESHDRIEHPCYYKSYTFTPDFPASFPMAVNLTGSGNFEECQFWVRGLLNQNSPCWVANCTFDGVYQPRLNDRPFVAYSNFAKTVNNLGLPLGNLKLQRIREEAIVLCSLSWEEVKLRYSNVSRRKRPQLCFAATYVYVMLTQGLGFPDSSSQIEFALVDRKNRSFDWAIGSMIYELNQLPPETSLDYVRGVKGVSRAEAVVGETVVLS